MTLRVYVGFNTSNADPEGRVSLPTHVVPELLDSLQPGQSIVMLTPYDIEVEAIVKFDTAQDQISEPLVHVS